VLLHWAPWGLVEFRILCHIILLICDNNVTNSKFVIFQEKSLKVLKCKNFLWVQRRHNCSPAASLGNCVMTLYLLKGESANVSFYTNQSKMPNFELWLLSKMCEIYVHLYLFIYCYLRPRLSLTHPVWYITIAGFSWRMLYLVLLYLGGSYRTWSLKPKCNSVVCGTRTTRSTLHFLTNSNITRHKYRVLFFSRFSKWRKDEKCKILILCFRAS